MRPRLRAVAGVNDERLVSTLSATSQVRSVSARVSEDE